MEDFVVNSGSAGEGDLLQRLNVRRLRRLMVNDSSLEPVVQGELQRRAREQVKRYSDQQLRNIRKSECVGTVTTSRAQFAKDELHCRGSWVHVCGDELGFSAAVATLAAALGAVACSLIAPPVRNSVERPPRWRRGQRHKH